LTLFHTIVPKCPVCTDLQDHPRSMISISSEMTYATSY